MKTRQAFLALALCAAALTSCGSAQSSLNALRSLNEDLRDNSVRFTAKDWRAAQDRLNKIQENMKRYEYTAEEMREIGKLKASCYVYMGKNTVETAVGDAMRTVNEVRGAAEGIKDAIKEIKK